MTISGNRTSEFNIYYTKVNPILSQFNPIHILASYFADI